MAQGVGAKVIIDSCCISDSERRKCTPITERGNRVITELEGASARWVNAHQLRVT